MKGPWGEKGSFMVVWQAVNLLLLSYSGDVQTCGFLNISAENLIDNVYNFVDIWENSTHSIIFRTYHYIKANAVNVNLLNVVAVAGPGLTQ